MCIHGQGPGDEVILTTQARPGSSLIDVPIPSRTGYTLLPPELDDADPEAAVKKQNAFARATKEKAAPAKA